MDAFRLNFFVFIFISIIILEIRFNKRFQGVDEEMILTTLDIIGLMLCGVGILFLIFFIIKIFWDERVKE